jgi:hypothetical protein
MSWVQNAEVWQMKEEPFCPFPGPLAYAIAVHYPVTHVNMTHLDCIVFEHQKLHSFPTFLEDLHTYSDHVPWQRLSICCHENEVILWQKNIHIALGQSLVDMQEHIKCMIGDHIEGLFFLMDDSIKWHMCHLYYHYLPARSFK